MSRLYETFCNDFGAFNEVANRNSTNDDSAETLHSLESRTTTRRDAPRQTIKTKHRSYQTSAYVLTANASHKSPMSPTSLKRKMSIVLQLDRTVQIESINDPISRDLKRLPMLQSEPRTSRSVVAEDWNFNSNYILLHFRMNKHTVQLCIHR